MRPRNPELAAAMARSGLNNKELAEKAGISNDTVSDISNLRRRPHPLTARAIATALGATVADLWPARQPLHPRTRKS